MQHTIIAHLLLVDHLLLVVDLLALLPLCSAVVLVVAPPAELLEEEPLAYIAVVVAVLVDMQPLRLQQHQELIAIQSVLVVERK
jgi:hypothetical protein